MFGAKTKIEIGVKRAPRENVVQRYPQKSPNAFRAKYLSIVE